MSDIFTHSLELNVIESCMQQLKTLPLSVINNCSPIYNTNK